MTVGNLVLPTDNAVIDYSIISQMVNAINDLQTQITKLAKSNDITETSTTTPAPGSSAAPVAEQKVKSGTTTIPANAGPVVVTVSGISNITQIVGQVQNPSSAQILAPVLISINKNVANFYVKGSNPKAGKLYWIAVGT